MALLSILGYHADNDDLRQRLEDTELSLKTHITLASDLAEQNEILRLREEQHLVELERHRRTNRLQELQNRPREPTSPPTPQPPTPQPLEQQPPATPEPPPPLPPPPAAAPPQPPQSASPAPPQSQQLQTDSPAPPHSQQSQTEETPAPPVDSAPIIPHCSQDAVIRALHGRTSRTLLRATMAAWRSHCDKALMMRNMHKALMRPAGAFGNQTSQQQQSLPLPPPPAAAPPLPPQTTPPQSQESQTEPSPAPHSQQSQTEPPAPPHSQQSQTDALAPPLTPEPPELEATALPARSAQAEEQLKQLRRLRWQLALLKVLRTRPRPPATVFLRQGRLPPLQLPSQPPTTAEPPASSGGGGNPWGDDESPASTTAASTAAAAAASTAAAASARPTPAAAPPPAAPAAQSQAAGATTAALPQRLLAWLAPEDEEEGSGGGSASNGSAGGSDNASMPASERVAALLVRLQHLWTENQFLRERVRMVEAEAQPLLTELSEKRELLHYAYVLCHRAQHVDALGRPVPMEVVTAWARGGEQHALKVSDDGPVEVADAMEAVLEATLRRNRKLEIDLATALKAAQTHGFRHEVSAEAEAIVEGLFSSESPPARASPFPGVSGEGY